MSPLSFFLVVSDTGYHCGGELWRGGVSLGTASYLTSIRSVSIRSRLERCSRPTRTLRFGPLEGPPGSRRQQLRFLVDLVSERRMLESLRSRIVPSSYGIPLLAPQAGGGATLQRFTHA